MKLYHYTCDDGRRKIGEEGWLAPGWDGWLWLTDLAQPDAQGLGLTKVILTCDRTAHRYQIDADGLRYTHPWWEARRLVNPNRVKTLESAPGVKPFHWWVSMVALHATYDPIGTTLT